MEPIRGTRSLADLRRSWEQDRSRGAMLRLAEAYRTRGELQDAAEVLEDGLVHYADHLAARVALGRCRMEMGDLTAARTLLESAVEQDPSQLVANKALVDTYLQVGELEKAREGLERYRILSPEDPDIERLTSELQRAATPRPVFQLESPATGNVMDALDLKSVSGPRRPPARREPTNGDPFRSLLESLEPRRQYAAAAVEDVFTFQSAGTTTSAPLPAATPTLARLYAEQGHKAEAAELYQEAEEQRSAAVERISAAVLLSELPAAELEAAGRVGRQVLVLNRYLERLRAGGEVH